MPKPLDMNPKIRAHWADTLRSDRFKQGRNSLARNDRYCCLGVLCELALEAGVEMEVERGHSPGVSTAYDGEVEYLPDAVLDWAGLEDHAPAIIGEFTSVELSVLNDTGQTFASIADLIEGKAPPPATGA